MTQSITDIGPGGDANGFTYVEAAKATSLQEQLLALEQGLDMAHGILDAVLPEASGTTTTTSGEEYKVVEPQPTVRNLADICASSLQRLNSRLETIAGLVGSL